MKSQRMRDSAINKLVFVFHGESNSGGIGLNSEATSDEMMLRPCVRIMNLTDGLFRFESLQIGVNNLRDHAGLQSYYDSCHGFENQLANSVEAGIFANNPHVHLIKTGQGGSVIAEWADDSPSGYWNKFLQRVNAGKLQMPSDTQWVVWFSFGINDAIAGTPVSDWKRNVIIHLDKIKAELPGVIIIMTQFQSMTTGVSLTEINNAIAEIADTEDNLFAVDTTGAHLRDMYHWSYEGLKTVGGLMAEITKNELGI
jgi:hypothetical protein